MDLIAVIETACGKKAELAFHPMQPGDVYETHADIDDIAVSYTHLDVYKRQP